MFSAIGTASNDGEKWDFGKCQTHVLHYWKRDDEESIHPLYLGNIFFFKVCLLISALSDHVYQKTVCF